MNKPEPYRLAPAAYPFHTAVSTRFADLDPNRHLNNVAVAALFEDNRVRMTMTLLGGVRAPPFPLVVAAASFSYLREGVYGADVEIGCGVASIGRTSWVTHQAAFQSGAPIATCEAVVVQTKDNAPTPIDDAWRATLERYLIQRP